VPDSSSANLYDFDPGTDCVPLEQLDAVDRSRWRDMPKRAADAPRYDDYDFSTVAQTLNTLHDRRSQRLLRGCHEGSDVHAGRAFARAPLDADGDVHDCDGLARLLAPILPVTADDLWRNMPEAGESVHLEDFPVTRSLSIRPGGTWERLLVVRETVNAALEEKRKDKVIGNSLEHAW
jgi:isoleucyl-tRNA synthetase